jgi:hypothetical protein
MTEETAKNTHFPKGGAAIRRPGKITQLFYFQYITKQKINICHTETKK